MVMEISLMSEGCRMFRGCRLKTDLLTNFMKMRFRTFCLEFNFNNNSGLATPATLVSKCDKA